MVVLGIMLDRQVILIAGGMKMVLTDAKRKTNMDFDRKNTKLIGMKLNKNTDADILAHLEKQENIQGYLKRLIREDMKKTGE
jgi:hypothetical protein